MKQMDVLKINGDDDDEIKILIIIVYYHYIMKMFLQGNMADKLPAPYGDELKGMAKACNMSLGKYIYIYYIPFENIWRLIQKLQIILF